MAGSKNQETPEESGGNNQRSGGNVGTGGENESAAVRRQQGLLEDWDYSVRPEEWVDFSNIMKALDVNEVNLGRFGGGRLVQPQWRGGGPGGRWVQRPWRGGGPGGRWVQRPWRGGGRPGPPQWRGGGPRSMGRGWHHRPPLE